MYWTVELGAGVIDKASVAWVELSESAVRELLVLLSLHDNRGRATGVELIRNLNEKGYCRRSQWCLLPILEYIVVATGFAHLDDNRVYAITRRGRTRLRDLCELAHASPSNVYTLNPDGFQRVRQLRRELGIYPFTNGRQVTDGPRTRETTGCSVYAVLLHESAAGHRYKIINRESNGRLPCVYVGMTSQTPLERFAQHRSGSLDMSSKYVERKGLCLMPLLYSALNKLHMTEAQAKAMEYQFAIGLRTLGFTVFAGHWDRPEHQYHAFPT